MNTNMIPCEARPGPVQDDDDTESEEEITAKPSKPEKMFPVLGTSRTSTRSAVKDSKVRKPTRTNSEKQTKKPGRPIGQLSADARSKSFPIDQSKNSAQPSTVEVEPQLLFSRLVFFFFPSNRANRARAMKMDKAVQFGASLANQWNSTITHLIMDEGMPYDEFKKFHKDVKALPGHVVVINGKYIADCITFGLLIGHTQRAYQVPGYVLPESTVAEAITSIPTAFQKVAEGVATAVSKTSKVPIEPKVNTTSEEGTGRKYIMTAKGTIKSSITKAISLSPPDDNARANDTFNYDDALSKMITEAKGVAHLPIEMEDGDEDTDCRPSSSERRPFYRQSVVSVQAVGNCETWGIPSPSSQGPELFSNSRTGPKEYPVANQDPMIMQRPMDGKWVKLRCKECGSHDFEDVRSFVSHCLVDHKLRYKTHDEAVNECGFPLTVPPTVICTDPTGQIPDKSLARVDDEEPAAKRLKTAWQDQFACMDKHDGKAEDGNPNAYTIKSLQEMTAFYERTDDPWRKLAFRRAITTLKKQTEKITTKEDALKLQYVGESIAEAIEKIVLTGKLRRLEEARDDPANQVLQLFMGIYGVGLAQASKWVQAGFRTLEDLQSQATLSENQKIGIEHYDDLQIRIPRHDVERHSAVVVTTLESIDPAVQCTVGGSYRRGAQSSGDIDMIITKPHASLSEIREIVLSTLVPTLTEAGFLVAELARTRSDTGSKWHGCCALDSGIWRRIDFLLVPWDEMGAALIYFTGNDIFNRSMRLLASRKGMRLNQKGLYKDVMRGKGREKVTEGELLEGRDEKKIFAILGVPWRPPEHRIC